MILRRRWCNAAKGRKEQAQESHQLKGPKNTAKANTDDVKVTCESDYISDNAFVATLKDSKEKKEKNTQKNTGCAVKKEEKNCLLPTPTLSEGTYLQRDTYQTLQQNN